MAGHSNSQSAQAVSRCPSARVGLRYRGSKSPKTWSWSCEPGQAERTFRWRSVTWHPRGGRVVHARVPRVQHDRQPTHAARASRLFPERGRTPRVRGLLVIELEVPQLRRMPAGESAYPFSVTTEHLGFDTYDFVEQRLVSHHYWFVGDEIRRFDSHHRYAWPAELDLMAELAGMRLRERWAGWYRRPFTGESHDHVSVWKSPKQQHHEGRRASIGNRSASRSGILCGCEYVDEPRR